MARVAGGVVTMGGACLTGGIIFLGSGRVGAGGAAAAGEAGLVAGAATGAGRDGVDGLLATASSSCFLARMAFITSPGLETCERSILGATACELRELDPEPV
jgi:hypothetical protein